MVLMEAIGLCIFLMHHSAMPILSQVVIRMAAHSQTGELRRGGDP